MRWLVVVLLVITLLFTSGCLGEKTVIKANVKITEREGKPVIESMNVSRAQISAVYDYREVTTNLPGIYMKTIWNSKQIDYWRSVEYTGSGEYEIISELIRIPDKGDRVDVIISVLDSNGKELTSNRVSQNWE